FAEKEPPQPQQGSGHVPAAGLFHGQDADAGALERGFHEVAGVEDRDGDIVAALSQPARQHRQLALTAADFERADEAQYLHCAVHRGRCRGQGLDGAERAAGWTSTLDGSGATRDGITTRTTSCAALLA